MYFTEHQQKSFAPINTTSVFILKKQIFLVFDACSSKLKHAFYVIIILGPVVQSVVSLMSSLRVISLTILADSIYNFNFLLKKCE